MLWEQLEYGFMLGAIYALIAVGYSLIYGVMRTVNFAHGDILMLGAYALFYASAVGRIASLIFAFLLCGTFSLCMERFVYRPLRSRSDSLTVVAAICLSLFLQNAAALCFTSDPKPICLPSAVFASRYGFLLCLCVMLLLLLWLFKTRTGLMVRAVAADSDAAALSGVPVKKIFSLVFLCSGMTAALSAFLYCGRYPAAFPLMGAASGLKAYTASVIGGIGSLPGAVLGGLVLGILETLTKGYIEVLTHGHLTAAFADGAIYMLLLLMLLFRPLGLLGKENKEKI